MSPEQFIQELQGKEREIQQACERIIPLKVSVAMEEHSKDNFRMGGFVDGGLHPWRRTMRQSLGKGEDFSRTPLLSRRRNLMNATKHRYTPYKATVYNDTKYADIHNDGGKIQVTERMRKFFWARYFDTKAEMFKILALKPVGSFINIPKRQFIGDSIELRHKVESIINGELTKILKL